MIGTIQQLNGKMIFDGFRRSDNLRSGYAYYRERCKQKGITPISFRDWAKVDQEYDLEWEAASYEYEQQL